MKKSFSGLFAVLLISVFAYAQDFCVGESVISPNGDYGQVVGVYENGQLAVQYPTISHPIAQNAGQLAHLYGTSGGFKVGDDVLSSTGDYGQVVGVYENGQLAVQYPTISHPIAQDAGQLAALAGCSGGSCQ